MIAERSRVWITGMGLVTPLGSDPDSFWASLLSGRSGAAPVRSFDTSGLPNHVGCELGELHVPDRLRRHVLGGRCCELAAIVADQAVRHAGLDPGSAVAASAAIVVGTTMGDVTQFESDRASHPEEPTSVADVATLAGRPLSAMARTVANMYGATGQVVTVPAACAAGNYASQPMASAASASPRATSDAASPNA